MSQIDDNNVQIQACQEDIERISKVLLANNLGDIGKNISKDTYKEAIDTFITNAKICCDQSILNTDPKKLDAQDEVTYYLKRFTPLKQLIPPIEEMKSLEYENALLKEEQKTEDLKKSSMYKKASKSTRKTESKEVSQEGHLYPVKLVSGWTEKLKEYNQKMDDFLEKIDSLEPTVDMTWLCKKIETFCRKINHALAMIRYEIVKALSAMYKQANAFSKFIDPIVNFNPVDIFACLGWVKNVINFFLKPYMTVIQFIKDFMTYTPPLVSEAASLVGKTASIPIHLIGVIDRTSFEAEGKDGKKKEFAQAVKEYVNIKVQPITLGDIMGGSAQTPKMEESKIEAAETKLAQKQLTNAETKLNQVCDEFKNYLVNSEPIEKIWVARPNEITSLMEWVDYYSVTTPLITDDPVKRCIDTPSMGQILFGKKYGKINLFEEKINTRRNIYYAVWGPDQIKKAFNGSNTYMYNIKSYYTLTYENSTKKNDLKRLDYYAKQIDFFKSFTPAYPKIPEYLDNIRDAVIEYQKAQIKNNEV